MSDAPTPPPDDALDALVFEFLEQAESAPERAPGVLEELCRRNPEQAPALRQRVDSLVKSGLWGAPVDRPDNVPEHLGEFRLVRRLGDGGMGVVYLAEQPSVGRRVALKLIRGEHLFAQKARARFLREARAIARLDHPSIVRVYTIGEEQGLPYLAMEYVAGAGLDTLLERLAQRAPTELRGEDARAALAEQLSAVGEAAQVEAEAFARGWIEFAVRMARDTALALEHAHRRGVLHRDVKPSNLLVAADGRVRLCDFGLAALEDGDALTRTGAQLGSLPYMAPEQLRGDAAAIGPATDVYALGVTLYELITLARPYGGDSEGGVRAAILAAQPRAMRLLNPSATLDVETVCAKALDPDPKRRYASAADFARDLTNVLELRPIEARPPNGWARARRWMQRRPAAAVALVAGALLLVAGPLGWELNRMRTVREVREAYERERLAREQSERDFRAALSAVGHVLESLANEDLRDAPRMQAVRLAAIDRARELFDELEQGRGDDEQLLREGADLYAARGDVLYDLGQYDAAIESGERALALLERLARVGPGEDTRARRANVLGDKAKSLQGAGRWHESLAPLEQVEALARTLAERDEASRDDLLLLAIALANIGEVLQNGGEFDAAREKLEDALVWVDRLQESAPESVDVAWAVGRVWGDLGDLAYATGDSASARASMERRVAQFSRACALAPGKRYYRFDLASASISLAMALNDLREIGGAERLLLDARDELERLLDEFPAAERYLRELWRLDQCLGALYGRSGRSDAARAIFRRGAERIERALRELPERLDVVMFAAQAEYNLAVSAIHAGESLERIEKEFDGVRRRVDSVLEREPGYALARQIRSMCGYNLALARCMRGSLDSALAAVEEFDRGVSGDSGELRFSADLWNELVLALRRSIPEQEARGEREAQWTERMFERLAHAVQAGYRDRVELESTAALESFRGDQRFAKLLELCAQP